MNRMAAFWCWILVCKRAGRERRREKRETVEDRRRALFDRRGEGRGNKSARKENVVASSIEHRHRGKEDDDV